MSYHSSCSFDDSAPQCTDSGQVRASSQPTTSCRACLPALLVKVDRMAIVVSRLLGTVCRSGGGHLVRAHGRRHVRVLRILDDVSTGGWRGYFTDLLVVLEGTRWCVHHSGRAERRATVRGAECRASRGTRKGRPVLRESVRRPPGRTATERPLAAGPPDAAHFDRATRDVWVGQVSIEHLCRREG